MCPSNTFVATPMLSKKMGCNVKFVDCNRYDLCISFEDLKRFSENIEKQIQKRFDVEAEPLLDLDIDSET